jgi:hypothetical protein
MLSLGLNRTQYAEYRRTITRSHTMKVTCHLLTPEHRLLRTIRHSLSAGQVDVTTPRLDGDSVEISRTASLRFFDPAQSLSLDDSTPVDNAFYLNRMVRVIYSVRCSFGWVDVPVFTGPIVSVDRDGDEVAVECQGKEVWALGSAVRTAVLKGDRDDVTKRILFRAGESSRYMRIPRGGGKAQATIGPQTKLWLKAWKAQAAAGRVLFYDGRGIATAKRKPTKTALVLRGGEGGLLWSKPRISYRVDSSIINYCKVVGRKPSKGKKTRPSAEVVAPRGHTLSPWRLGRNGEPLYLTGDGRAFIENPDLKTNAACRRLAERTIQDSLLQHVEVTCETFPIPDLEPWDILQVATRGVSVRFRVDEFTLPLVQRGDGESMSIGARKPTKRFTYASERRRRKPRRRR